MSNVDQQVNQAMQRHQAGDTAAAETIYRQTLERQPEHPQALHLMGILHGQRQEHAAAVPYFERALVQNPEWPEAHNNLGASLTRLGRYDEAVRHFQTALKLRPAYANALYNQGNAFVKLNRAAEAVACFEQALAADSGYTQAYLALAEVRQLQGQHDEAFECFRKALEIDPENVDALYNYGCALLSLSRYPEAAAQYRKVIALKRDHADGCQNLAVCLQAMGQFAESVAASESAIALFPEKCDYHVTRALTWLLAGDFQRGWPEYEWRLKIPDTSKRPFDKPLWDGSALAGRIILVHTEQGCGDTFQFIRYLPMLQKLEGRVILQYPTGMETIIRECSGYETALSESEASVSPLIAEEQFDCHIPLLSLPAAFGTTMETIPAEIPYIAASAEKTAEWRKKLTQLAGEKTFKVGIVWAGNPNHQNDQNRSADLSDFAALAAVPGAAVFSLQKNVATRRLLQSPLPLIDLSAELRDFSDTAAVIDCLDLVISVDTSVAHLAGAMGKPVWTLLPFAPDWRWMLERDDTPWYPSMRLFRQEQPKEWKSVLEKVAVNLCNEIGVRAWETGDVQAALTAFLQALQRDPEDRDTVLNCADVFKAFGQHDDARRLLQSYLTRHPDDDEIVQTVRQYEEEPALAA